MGKTTVSKSEMPVRLMISDDHPAIRKGVVEYLEGTEIEAVCQAETCKQTVEFALACKPDVLLLDLRLPDADGLEALEAIKKQDSKAAVLIFSASEDVKEMARARKLGAVGFVSKATSREDLLYGIRRAATGASCWTPRQIRQVVSRAATEALAANDRNPLSPREMKVLKLITEGSPNDAVAEKLDITIETVKQHVKHILRKLAVEDRTQAALTALWMKLFENTSAEDL
jgi:two-component system, NarL family, response regulator LiaR